MKLPELKPQNDKASALQTMRPLLVTGLTVILVFFVGFGSWAAIAPLQSAAIGPGVLTVESQRKTIQHLEGGIVAEILVAEGDEVQAGQMLIRLDDTQAKAQLAQLEVRRNALKALIARLTAERDGSENVDGRELLKDEKVRAAFENELRIFKARRQAMQGEEGIINQRISQFREEIKGLQGQMHEQSAQIRLIDEELKAQQKLFDKKLIGMQRMIELKRERSEIIGARNQQRAAVARIKQSIAEQELRILELSTSRLNDSVSELTDVQTTLADLEERIVAAADVLTRTEILAPLSGQIVDLQVHTTGGVLGRGEPVLDIVPLKENLVVDARIDPSDIDSIRPGMSALVTLGAFSQRTVPPVKGLVLSVSADRLIEDRTGIPYYLARVELPEKPFPARDDLVLSPGMQADVMIITGEHTALEYLLKPVSRSFTRALREE